MRQATSTVFKFIVSRDSNHPIILKLVLQGLAANWPVQPGQPKAHILSWECREGRLLAYELLLRFLITNHAHYLLPTMLLSSPGLIRMGDGKRAPCFPRRLRRYGEWCLPYLSYIFSFLSFQTAFTPGRVLHFCFAQTMSAFF